MRRRSRCAALCCIALWRAYTSTTQHTHTPRNIHINSDCPTHTNRQCPSHARAHTHAPLPHAPIPVPDTSTRAPVNTCRARSGAGAAREAEGAHRAGQGEGPRATGVCVCARRCCPLACPRNSTHVTHVHVTRTVGDVREADGGGARRGTWRGVLACCPHVIAAPADREDPRR